MNLNLSQKFDTLLENFGHNFFKAKSINLDLDKNLNPKIKLREYQKEALGRFVHYLEDFQAKTPPLHTLFNMATGSGKTVIMAALILYLYKKGYRNFLFFVNSKNILEKTKQNFLNSFSSKYLFSDKIIINGESINIREIESFDEANISDINISFKSIQGLHSNINTPREDSITLEDFKDKEIVLISDEAHHINALSKKKKTKDENLVLNTWETTIQEIFNSNEKNLLLEFTATMDLDNKIIFEKYKDKLIYEYNLKQFRLDGYSKEIQVLEIDLEPFDRIITAIILSQYRLKIGQKNKLFLKPILLIKSKTIKESKENYEYFLENLKKLNKENLISIKNIKQEIIQKAFKYLEDENINLDNFIKELKEDFNEEKSMLLDSKNIDPEKQILLNSLEDKDNEIRIIFAVDMLNEGWDVLNLFDIVRLYETRNKNTTIQEAQLIGRGARYFPFILDIETEKYKRKYDDLPDSELKVLEELFYHSSYNPKYISEIKKELRKQGSMPEKEKVKIGLKLKESVKKSNFWKNALIFLNERRKINKKEINGLPKEAKYFQYSLKTGSSILLSALEDGNKIEQFERETKVLKFRKDFSKNIIRFTLDKLDFYEFENLLKFYPYINSIDNFIENYLSDIEVEIKGINLSNINSDIKIEILKFCLEKVSKIIEENITDYEGTKVFKPNNISAIIKDFKPRFIEKGREEAEGIKDISSSMDEYLDLSKKDWYAFEEAYGTIEEKKLIFFINSIIKELKNNYKKIMLIRNEGFFHLYDFKNGNKFFPDFVLFLKQEGNEKDYISYQVFIEPKGHHLIDTDKWKEDFLKSIEKEHKFEVFYEDKEYKIIGMPFYNDTTKKEEFKSVFKEKFL